MELFPGAQHTHVGRFDPSGDGSQLHPVWQSLHIGICVGGGGISTICSVTTSPRSTSPRRRSMTSLSAQSFETKSNAAGRTCCPFVIGTASQLRDGFASENEGQFHPPGRLETCGMLRAFPLCGECQGLRPANRHRRMVLACCGF